MFNFDGLKKAIAAGVSRWVMTLAGGLIAGWVLALAHKFGFSDILAGRISGDLLDLLGAITLGGTALVLGVKDRKSVGGKMIVTAQQAYDAGVSNGQSQGETVQYNADQARADAVKSAIAAADAAAPKDKAALLASLP